MDWNIESRSKLARLVLDKSVSIALESQEPFHTLGDYNNLLERINKKILEYFVPLGFESADLDEPAEEKVPWAEGTMSKPVMLRQSSTHLFFETCKRKVIKIEKEKAEKLVVLGLP